MDNSLERKYRNKIKRACRNRANLRGTADMPRLCVVKSNKHLRVQLIDDESAKTLASTSTVSKEFKNTEFCKRSKESAKQLGLKIAELAMAKSVKRAIFDRGPFKYHGVIAALAEGAREGGLEV